MVITKHYIGHPFLSHSIFPEDRVYNEKEQDGSYAEDPKEDYEATKEEWVDLDEDSIHSLHNKNKR